MVLLFLWFSGFWVVFGSVFCTFEFFVSRFIGPGCLIFREDPRSTGRVFYVYAFSVAGGQADGAASRTEAEALCASLLGQRLRLNWPKCFGASRLGYRMSGGVGCFEKEGEFITPVQALCVEVLLEGASSARRRARQTFLRCHFSPWCCVDGSFVPRSPPVAVGLLLPFFEGVCV